MTTFTEQYDNKAQELKQSLEAVQPELHWHVLMHRDVLEQGWDINSFVLDAAIKLRDRVWQARFRVGLHLVVDNFNLAVAAVAAEVTRKLAETTVEAPFVQIMG